MGEINKVAMHADLCKQMNATYAKKNHDYGDSFHLSFLDEGLAMARIRLGDKYNRFKTLSKDPARQVDDESMRDTLLDLANYAIMTVMEMDIAAKDATTGEATLADFFPHFTDPSKTTGAPTYGFGVNLCHENGD